MEHVTFVQIVVQQVDVVEMIKEKNNEHKKEEKCIKNKPIYCGVRKESKGYNILTGSKNLSGELQLDKSKHVNVSKPKRIRRVKKCNENIDKCSTEGDRTTKRETKEVLDGGTNCEKMLVTLQDVKTSLSDEILKKLLNNTYNKNEKVIISKRIYCNLFKEDEYLQNITIKRKVKRAKSKKSILPSNRYIHDITNYKKDNTKINANVILGTYFILYKKFYNEEDPEWINISSDKIIMIINKMHSDMDIPFSNILLYINKIMPLWYMRLKNNSKFPGNRPSINALFIKKHFWANRKVYFKQWQKEQ